MVRTHLQRTASSDSLQDVWSYDYSAGSDDSAMATYQNDLATYQARQQSAQDEYYQAQQLAANAPMEHAANMEAQHRAQVNSMIPANELRIQQYVFCCPFLHGSTV